MYKQGEMYSVVKSYIAHHKVELTRTAAGGLVSLMMASPSDVTELKPDFYPQRGAPNTMTYQDPSGKEIVVYDLRGKWEADYPEGREVVKITQKGNSFKGVKTIGDYYVGRGETTIKGTIEGNLIDCKVYHSADGWQGTPGKISEDGNSFECEGELVREYRRLLEKQYKTK